MTDTTQPHPLDDLQAALLALDPHDVGETTARGYHAEQLDDAWERYVPTARRDMRNSRNGRNGPASAVTGVTPVTGTVPNGARHHHEGGPDVPQEPAR